MDRDHPPSPKATPLRTPGRELEVFLIAFPREAPGKGSTPENLLEKLVCLFVLSGPDYLRGSPFRGEGKLKIYFNPLFSPKIRIGNQNQNQNQKKNLGFLSTASLHPCILDFYTCLCYNIFCTKFCTISFILIYCSILNQ